MAGRSRLARREAIEGYLFISPWILGFVVFRAGPALASFGISLTDWPVIGAAQWVGLQNYGYMLTGDHLFWQSLNVTFTYALIFLPLSLALSLATAMLMNQNVRGITVFRTIYYLPSVVSGVAVAVLWNWIFDPHFGVLNDMLDIFGIKGPAWLQDEQTALPSFVIIGLWGIGASMVIYLAGLQGIPTELYEAAMIDGANWWHKLWAVTVPMLSPVIFLNLVMGLIGVLQSDQVFTWAYVTTMGGPMYRTYFYGLHLYLNAFQYYRMGYASALAWVLLVMMLLLTDVVFRTSTFWVYYAGERGDRA